MNIYFEVENFNREIESRILLAMEAVKNGNKVYISDRVQILENAFNKKLEPGIIFLKDVNSEKYVQDKLKKIKENGFIIIAIDEEAGIQFNKYEDFIKARSLRKFDNIDIFLCWGLRDKNILKKKFVNNNTKFLALGSPRIDLCKTFLLEKKKFFSLKKKINEKYVLISSNINFPIGIRKLPEFVLSRISENKEDAEWKEKYIYYKWRNHTELCYYLVKLIRKLAEEFPQRIFVVRPHPNEKISSWEKILVSKYKNLKIIKSGSIADYIYNSDILLHSGCTSGIESFLMNKNSISYLPKALEYSYDRELSDNLSILCKSENEILNILKEKTNIKKRNNVELKNRVMNLNSSKSFKKINMLFNILRTKKNFKSRDCKNVFRKNSKITYNVLKKLKNITKRAIGIKTGEIDFHEKFPPIQKSDISEMINDLKNIDNYYNETHFNILNESTIEIYK